MGFPDDLLLSRIALTDSIFGAIWQAWLTKAGYLSMIGFTTTMMANWEAEALSISAGLLNGGNVALIYGYILVFFGTLATASSLGELASMYPTAGGQYHFVALLTPGKLKNVLSFLAGYISILAWQATTASCAFLAATVVSWEEVIVQSVLISRRHKDF